MQARARTESSEPAPPRDPDHGDYAPDLGPLKVQAALMDDLIGHRECLGVDALRMREIKGLMDARIAAGHGDQGFSSLFAQLPKPTP